MMVRRSSKRTDRIRRNTLAKRKLAMIFAGKKIKRRELKGQREMKKDI